MLGHQPNDIWKSAWRNEASVRLPCSQPSGPSGANDQAPRQAIAFDDPVSEATTSSPSARRCQVLPLNGSRGANRDASVNHAEAIGRPSSSAAPLVRARLP